MTGIAAIRSKHAPMRIYDECEHDHQQGDPGTVDTGEFITCEAEYLYSICSSCCVENPAYPEQAEWCCDDHDHDHREGWTCDVPALLDEVDRLRALTTSEIHRRIMEKFEREGILTAAAERDEARAEVERLRGLLDAYTAVVCDCGHERTSHNPADFGDCTECPYGTCRKFPGISWDLWHRDTLARAEKAEDAVDRVAPALDQEWQVAADRFGRPRDAYAEGYLDGLDRAATVARDALRGDQP
jgi:hypothetical protein